MGKSRVQYSNRFAARAEALARERLATELSGRLSPTIGDLSIRMCQSLMGQAGGNVFVYAGRRAEMESRAHQAMRTADQYSTGVLPIDAVPLLSEQTIANP